jgi:phenylacetate-CoA ligase
MAGLGERLYARCPIPIQNLVISHYGRRILRERFGAGFEETMAFLERSERLSSEEIEAYQNERLRAMARHAYETVPHYRDAMDARRLRPSDVRTIADLTKFPITTREDVVGNPDSFLSRAADRRRLRRATSSGTTGNPVTVDWDTGVSIMNNACLQRTRRWAGFEFGRPYATLMGRMVVPVRQTRPPFWRLNRPWNQLFLSPVHLSQEYLPHYVRKLREAKIEALDAYPSSAYVLARHLESSDQRLPLRAVFTSSESLLPLEREVIERAFECRVFDAYSQTERVLYSSECEMHSGHHVFQEYGIMEVVDSEGSPTPPGERGRVVATGLQNMAMPLIRYSMGDTAVLSNQACACGRTLQLLEEVGMKAQDILVTPDGRMIPPGVATGSFKGVRSIVRSQIVQDRAGAVLVRLVVRKSYGAEDENAVRRGLSQCLGAGVRIEFELVDDIPLSGRGKFRRIISTVPLAWGNATSPNLYKGHTSSSASGSAGGRSRAGSGADGSSAGSST